MLAVRAFLRDTTAHPQHADPQFACSQVRNTGVTASVCPVWLSLTQLILRPPSFTDPYQNRHPLATQSHSALAVLLATERHNTMTPISCLRIYIDVHEVLANSNSHNSPPTTTSSYKHNQYLILYPQYLQPTPCRTNLSMSTLRRA
jgi:hypothetical protein